MANTDITQRAQYERSDLLAGGEGIRRGAEKGAAVYTVIALVVGIALCVAALATIDNWAQWLVLGVIVVFTAAVMAAGAAPDGFDARRDARSRTYCYRMLAERTPNPFEAGLSLHWPHRVDADALVSCADALLGTHDFTAFTPTQTEHVRFERDVLRAEWHERPALLGHGRVLEFWVEADAFMRNMVRTLIGTMLEVAGGRRSLEDFETLLEGAPRERAGETARAHGLHLASVSYQQG